MSLEAIEQTLNSAMQTLESFKSDLGVIVVQVFTSWRADQAALFQCQNQLSEQAKELAAAYARIKELEALIPTAYISADGTGDGTTEDKAAPLSLLNVLIGAVGPGGIVELLPGVYHGRSTTINMGGVEGRPVIVRGRPGVVFCDGRNTGDGSIPWVPPTDVSGARNVKQQPMWGAVGSTCFKLSADWLTFQNIVVQNHGRAFEFVGERVGLTFEDIEGFNVQDLVWQNYAKRADGTYPGSSKLVYRRIKCLGFSKSAIRLDGSTHEVLIDNFDFDSGFQSNDEFAVGIKIGTSSTNGGSAVHDVTIRRGRCTRCIDIETDKYWNGDGICIEGGDYNITIEDYEGSWNSDAGIDTKGQNIRLIRPILHDNKDNVRVWGELHIIDGKAYSNHKIAGTPYGDPKGGTGVSMNVMVNKERAQLHLWGSFDGSVGLHEGATSDQVFDHRPSYPDWYQGE